MDTLDILKIFILTFGECLIIGSAIYFTTVFTLRAWHCFKNVKVDPINAVKSKDISAARAEELRQNYQNIISMG